MTNEVRRDLNRDRRENQKDILATHARQLKYLDTCSRSEADRENNYTDIATLPGVKVPFVSRPVPPPRRTMRNSIRKLPRRSSSAKDKKKEADKRKVSDNDKSKQIGKKLSTSSHPEQACSPDTSRKNGHNSQASATCEKVVVTELQRPILHSLNASELMLVSSDKGDLGTMQVLLKKRSEEPSRLCVSKDSNGETPLHKTAKGGYLKCLKFLAAQVPDQVSCVDNSGMTPAAHAAKNGHVNCLKWLIEESSAYVELAVRDGQTHLLHSAASEGMEQCLTYLLAFMAKRKITTEIVDGQGQSPLHVAAKTGHLACVQTLVEHGGDVLAKDHEGLTSASVAYIHKQSICSRYLLMAESCWILASRVSTLFREVNGYKKENRELKKSVENLKARKKSFPKDLPHRPETVGAHVDESGNQIEDISLNTQRISIGLRNFPDGESPKNTFTEADKRRPQYTQEAKHVINRDAEVNDIHHLRQGSNSSDPIPVVSANSIAEIAPAEKIKAKEIAMVTHQLMSTRHSQLVKNKKIKDMSPPEVVPDVKPEEKITVDDSAVVMRKTSTRGTNTRPKSLCEKDLRFMRSSSDLGFTSKLNQAPVLERRASCTEINKHFEHEANNTYSQLQSSDSDPSLSDTTVEKETLWDRVGARKLLSRKRNSKPRPLSGGLSDLQTVSTDKILELYARESRGSTSRLNSLIMEEDDYTPTMGRRSMSSLELQSHAYMQDSNTHASFHESSSPNFNPLSDFRNTASTSVDLKSDNIKEKKQRPVAKPRLRLRTSNEIMVSKQTVETFTTPEVHRTVRQDNLGVSDDVQGIDRTSTLDRYGYNLDKKYEKDHTGGVESTDV